MVTLFILPNLQMWIFECSIVQFSEFKTHFQNVVQFLDWKNHQCENDYTTQSNLQIQSNLYQTTNGIFHRSRKKFHNLYGNTKDPQ